VDLTAEKRDIFGKTVRILRNKGLIPAELYGHGVENLHLAVKSDDFRKIFKSAGENTIVNLILGEAAKKQSVLIHDIQKNRLTEDIEHIDFYAVRMDEKLKAHIPVEFTGIAPAVKEKGGLLNKTVSEIEVEALPGDLPRSFIVDVRVLSEINQSIHVKDIDAPKGVRVLLDPEAALVTVMPPKKEEEIAPPPPVAEDISQIKVETEEKKAERTAQKSEEENAAAQSQ